MVRNGLGGFHRLSKEPCFLHKWSCMIRNGLGGFQMARNVVQHDLGSDI